MMESSIELQKMYDEHAKMKKALEKIVKIGNTNHDNILDSAYDMIEIAEQALS